MVARFAAYFPLITITGPWRRPASPCCGDRRFRAGGHFLQFLVKGREIGWPLLLGSRGCANHRCGLRVRLGQTLSAIGSDGF